MSRIMRFHIAENFGYAVSPARKASPKNPIMYPPVGPASFAKPPANPENTGTPIAPMTIYSAVAGTETFAPKISENKEITKIASVNGIVGDSGFGIAQGAVTQRIAAISAM